MDWPLELRRPPLPMRQRPEAPAPGERVQVLYYNVECRRVSGWDEPWYYVRNRDGEILSFEQNWERMCHVLGWYPMPGLEPDQTIPRAAAPPGRRKPRTLVRDDDPRETLPLFGDDSGVQ